jgi:hypothetical protein
VDLAKIATPAGPSIPQQAWVAEKTTQTLPSAFQRRHHSRLTPRSAPENRE